MTALDIDVDTDIEPTPALKQTRPSSSARSFMFHRNYKWLVPLFLGIFAAVAFFYLSEFEASSQRMLMSSILRAMAVVAS
jgi:hypothetical protein